MFPTLSYLEWIIGRPSAARHDLGSSDLRPAEHGDEVVPTALRDLPDPPADTTLEDVIAAEYGVKPANVLVTAGATHANFLAAAAALGRTTADEPHVLVEKPGYEPLVATPAGLGARTNRFLRTAASGYDLDPDRIAGAMTAETALVTATNHHNPSGRLVGRDRLAAASEIAADADAMLLVDEVYAPMAADPVDGMLGGPTGASLSNTVVTNSLTKFFGLGGVSIGWLVASESFVDRARSVQWHVPAVADPSRRLALRALTNADTLAERSRDLATARHALLADFVEDRPDLTGFVTPGCTFAFPAHERADGDAVTAAAAEAGVLVVPGRFFDAPDGFRLSLGRGSMGPEAGLAALGDVLDGL